MTLTDLSYYSRRLLPFLILFFLIFLIFFYSFKLLSIYFQSNQPKVIYTNEIFGKINEPVLELSTSSANFKFSLDTVEGQPVTATETAKIYFLPQTTPRFGYREKIYLVAKAFGFTPEVVKYTIIDKKASFSDGTRQLTIDIGNYNFKFESKVDDSMFISSQSTIPSKGEIENKAVDFLKSIGRYPEELAKGTTNIIYLKYNPEIKNFINVDKKSEAQLVEIDFYRPNIDSFSIVTPKFFNSQNYVVMMFDGNQYKIIKGQVAFFEKSEEQIGLYPVITGEEAWQRLNNGQGKVVAATLGKKNIIIKKMFLGYLDPDIYQNYLQPVYVFLGDSDFVCYVPAVKE